MAQTKIQKTIEKVITNGLGYDSRTLFKYEDFNLPTLVENSDISRADCKNSKEGLQRHLKNLDRITNPSPTSKLGEYNLTTLSRKARAAAIFGLVALAISGCYLSRDLDREYIIQKKR